MLTSCVRGLVFKMQNISIATLDMTGAPLQRGRGHSSAPLQQGRGHTSAPLQQGRGHSSAPLQQGRGHSSAPLQQGRGHSSAPLHGGRGHSSAPLQQGRGHSSAPLHGGRGHSSAPLQQGRGHSSAPLHGGRGHSSAPLQQGRGHSSAPLQQGRGHSSAPLQQGRGHSSAPLQQGRGHSSAPLQQSRGHSSGSQASDPVETLLKLCTERFFIASGRVRAESLQRGAACVYGPLGTELKQNILEHWWKSVMRSRSQVFRMSTLHTSKEGPFKVVDSQAIQEVLNQSEGGPDRLVQKLNTLLQRCYSARTSLLPGALEQYVSSLELVNRRLPFGLAEAGLCFQPSDAPGCPAEVTQTLLVWFCSPRTSSQWLDYWARQRLQWWRKFALSPSDFSSCDVTDEELGGRASRGVQIVYSFPWGPQPLESLLSLGDAELLQAHSGSRSKLHCRDGRKSVVPHVLSVTGNMDRGLLAYMFNSLQQADKVDSRQKLLQRKVLKLHPALAPVKVSLDTGRGATVERRQVCEGLLQEFLEGGIPTWPGYLESAPSSVEQLNTKYDEMGVLFSVSVGENTLESGLLQVRSRDTTIKETMHISEVKNFVSRYISAADNI